MENKEIILKHFNEIVKSISSNDRIEAAKEFNVHQITIYRYVNGKIGKEDFAINLIIFFKQKIKERENKISML